MSGVPGLLLAKRYTNLTHLPDKDGFFTPPNAVGGGVRRVACSVRRAFTQIGKSIFADATLGFLFPELKEIALNHTAAQPCLLGHWEKTLPLCCH